MVTWCRMFPPIKLGPTDAVPITAIGVLMWGIWLRENIAEKLDELPRPAA